MDAPKKKVVGTDIEFGMSKDSVKDLIMKLESNYMILYSIAKKCEIDSSYIELLEQTFNSNLNKIYELLDENKNDRG